ncbi:MAG: DUF6049 family protein [Actinomycetota bacterium]
MTLFAVALLAVALCAVTAPASARDATEAVAQDAVTSTTEPGLDVLELGADVTDPDILRLVDHTTSVTGSGVYQAVVDVGNAADQVELLVNVHDRVADREAFQATVRGERLGTALTTLPPRPLTDFERTANGSARVVVDLNDGTIPIEPGQVRLSRPGVYPVVYELRTAQGEVLDRMIAHIVRLADPGVVEPLGVGVALRVDAPPGHRPDGTIGFSASARERLTILVDAIERHPEVPVALEIVPEILEALSLSPDPTDRDLARRLTDRPDQRIVLANPYVRVDPSGMQAAGLDEVLLDLEQRGGQVLETLLDRQPRSRTWLAGDRISATGLRYQLSRGVREAIVPERALLIADPNAPTALGPVELLVPSSEARVDTLVVDARLSEAFDLDDDPVLAAEHLLAELALIAFDAADDEDGLDDPGLVITPPEDWTPNPAFLGRLLVGLQTTPVIETAPVDELFDLDPALDDDGRPVTRQLLGRVADAPDADLELWQLTDDRVSAFDSMAADATGVVLAGELQDRLRPSWSVELRREDRERYWAATRSIADEHITAIVPPPERSFTLTSREDEIPLRLRNDSTLPLRVVVRLESDKLEFPEGPERTLVIPAGEVADQAIAVKVLTSGAFPVTVEVDTADGEMPLAVSRITIRSTVLSGLGILLTAGAVGLLGVWWLVDHRRRRRRSNDGMVDGPVAGVGVGVTS